MKHYYLVHSFLLLLSLSVLAQTQKIEYTYDYAGNRISRRVITLTVPEDPYPVKKHTEDPVNEQLGERTIKVYPNPTKGALAVEITGGDEKDAIELQLISGQGTRLQTIKAMSRKTPVDMLAYPAGWYILRIVAGKDVKEIKIIKQ